MNSIFYIKVVLQDNNKPFSFKNTKFVRFHVCFVDEKLSIHILLNNP